MKTFPDIISRLKSATPQKRIKIIKRLYNKNVGYFAVKHPAISQMLKDVPCPYEITITDDFLDIIDSRTNERCHPDIGLDHFAETLGDWTGKAWVDFINPALRTPNYKSNHTDLLNKFNQLMHDAFPQFQQRFISYEINLPKTEDGLRFSNPVIFIGVFHGMHIAHYLNRTYVRTAAFLEPEPQRFEVSCYFLDYAEIDKHFNGLLLHVGDILPDRFFIQILQKALITNTVWTRILGGYASQKFEAIITQLRMDWAAINDEWIPADRELRALQHGFTNLTRGEPLLLNPVKLSSDARIAVVGAGPSLNNDLKWLKEHQEKIIIFATHSSLKPLRNHDIRPDFQFSLDLETSEQEICNTQYDFDKPIVVDYKVDPLFLNRFKSRLMVADAGTVNGLRFHNTLKHGQPTTGNLTLALACYCQPAEIYLLGLDFGFRKLSHTHARGSMYDDPELEVGVQGLEQWEVMPNFTDAEPVYTRHYFNTARIQANAAITDLPPVTKTYNLSDGARIDGTIPKHSETIILPSYPEKHADLATIKAAFGPSVKGIHWHPFTQSGDSLVKLLQTTLHNNIKIQTFSWPEFTQKLDSAISRTREACQELSKNDDRMMPYFRITHDLLLSWYAFMVFANSSEEAEFLYQKGLSHITDIINSFKWPDGLD
jgi:uncharacterized Rossmann fold enzyme